MKSMYELTLGRKDIEVLHNGAEQACSEIASPRPEPFSEHNPFVLCFIGGLFSHLHGDCIEDIFEEAPIHKIVELETAAESEDRQLGLADDCMNWFKRVGCSQRVQMSCH